MLRAHQQLIPAPRLQLLVCIQHQNPGAACQGQTGIACGGKIPVPRIIDNPGTEAAGNRTGGVGRAGVYNDNFIHRSAYTPQTAGQVVGFIFDDHAQGNQRLLRFRGHKLRSAPLCRCV